MVPPRQWIVNCNNVSVGLTRKANAGIDLQGGAICDGHGGPGAGRVGRGAAKAGGRAPDPDLG